MSVSEEVWMRSQKNGCQGKTATLKIKFNDFQQITRAMSLDHLFQSETELRGVLLGLLQKEWPLSRPVRLVGAQLSGLVHNNTQVRPSDGDTVEESSANYPSQYPLSF